jgi:hypothetical protein
MQRIILPLLGLLLTCQISFGQSNDISDRSGRFVLMGATGVHDAKNPVFGVKARLYVNNYFSFNTQIVFGNGYGFLLM